MPAQIENRSEYFAVQNFEAVYADVEATWQDSEQAEKYHRWASTVLKPTVHFGPGVEDRMTQEVDDGALCAIAFSHGKFVDPLEIAAMAWQQKSFQQLVGKTMIGAKVPLFTAPIIGEKIQHLGAVPIWRKQDVTKAFDRRSEFILHPAKRAEVHDRLQEVRKKAGKAFVATEITGMNSGHHMAKHVEGTRNKKHPLEIQEIRDGFGNVVSGVNTDANILIMTGAFYYGKWLRKTWLNPTIYIDILKDQDRSEPEKITRAIKPALQDTLKYAVALHR